MICHCTLSNGKNCAVRYMLPWCKKQTNKNITGNEGPRVTSLARSVFAGSQKASWHTMSPPKWPHVLNCWKHIHSCQCLFQTTHNVKLLHEVLMPVSALDLGGSLQTMSDLRRRWNAMKPQLQVKMRMHGFGWMENLSQLPRSNNLPSSSRKAPFLI